MHRSQAQTLFKGVNWILGASLAAAAMMGPRTAQAISEGYGTLHVCKNVQWGDWPQDPQVGFELCIVGPLDGETGPGDPQCASFSSGGGSHHFEGLIPGEYEVYETDPGAGWIATHWEEVCPPKPNPPTPQAEQPGPSMNVQVWSDETTCATIRNTYTGPSTGSISVLKVVDFKGEPIDENVTFEICVSRMDLVPTFVASQPNEPNCQTIGAAGGTLSWEGLDEGMYLVLEADPGVQWTVSYGLEGSPSEGVYVPAGSTTEVTITNELIPPADEPGSITIIKASEPAGGMGFSFEVLRPIGKSLTSEPLATFILDDGRSETVEDLMPGMYMVREIVPADWSLDATSIVCNGQFEPLSDGVQVFLSSGEDVVCTFTNECAQDEPPVITCPADLEIPAGGTFDLEALAPATAVGNCGFEVMTAREITSDIAGDCPVARVVTVTWTATDDDGRTSTCEQTIRISDADTDGDGTVDCQEEDDPAPPDPDDDGDDDGDDSGQEQPPLLEEVIDTTTTYGLPCCGGAGFVPLSLSALGLAAFMSPYGRRRFRGHP